MTVIMSRAERDTRVSLLNSFLTTPHRELEALASLHGDALEMDQLFYGRLALWYIEQGEVRDHKVLFVAHLITSAYPELREAGWVLLQEMAPYEVARVLDHAKRVIGKVPRILKRGHWGIGNGLYRVKGLALAVALVLSPLAGSTRAQALPDLVARI